MCDIRFALKVPSRTISLKRQLRLQITLVRLAAFVAPALHTDFDMLFGTPLFEARYVKCLFHAFR